MLQAQLLSLDVTVPVGVSVRRGSGGKLRWTLLLTLDLLLQGAFSTLNTAQAVSNV